MSERLIQVSTLTEIADAIRDKKGTVNPIPVSSYASEIATIETGGGQSDKPFNLVSYFNGTLTEVDDVNGVIEEVGVVWNSSVYNVPSYMSSGQSPIAFVNMPELSYINLAGCKKLKVGAIVNCPALETINLPECETVGANATSWLSGAKVINLPKCSDIGMSAFNHPSSYGSDITINIPDFCDIAYNDVCSGPSYYTSKYASFNGVSFGVCISLYSAGANYLDASCFTIATARSSQSRMTFLQGTGIKWVCFRATSGASRLSGINLPNCEKIFSYAFSGCYSLSKVTLPKCWYVGRGAFAGCSSLTDISSVPLTHIEDYAFERCINLSVANWSIIEHIGNYAFAYNQAITELPSTLNSAITELNAFSYCSNLVSVSNPYLKKVAFPYCSALNYVNLPNCEELLSYGFRNCSALTSIYLPALKRIPYGGAFASNSALVSVSFPELEEITGQDAFSNCYGLTEINLPKCSYIGRTAFNNCSNLVSINLPNVISVEGYAFARTAIESIYLPNCEYMEGNIFVSCYMLSSVSLPKLRTISGDNHYGVFGYCSALSIVDLPALEYIGTGLALSSNIIHTVKLSNISHISGTAFSRMYSLVSLYIYASSVPILDNTYSAFYSTPIYSSINGVWGSIYVPASLYDEYKETTNWTVLSSRFVSM